LQTHFAAGRIGGALGFNQKILSLTMKHNLFGDAGARELCRGLAMNQTLSKLTLDFCDIGPEGAEAIGQGAATNASWTELSLNGNRVGSKGLVSASIFVYLFFKTHIHPLPAVALGARSGRKREFETVVIARQWHRRP
jgi:hypothetical protein